MKLSAFDYPLPEELIAKYPPPIRGESRLLVYDRSSGKINHLKFPEIGRFFEKKDLLVLNDTKVFPARLYGRKPSGGKVEALLLKELEKGRWEVMLKMSKGPRKGMPLCFDGGIEATVEERLGGTWVLNFRAEGDLMETLKVWGRIPLPPYIDRESEDEDSDRYQTVYAKKEGAVAAPTAGLHFTPEILEGLSQKGVATEMVTLHVGAGTFQPVRSENIEDHIMHSEFYEIGSAAAERINSVRLKGGRSIAVGTTAVRVLESSFEGGKVLPKKGWTDIFIRPQYNFRAVDCLITNFHLPMSTLFMLVSAFVGTEKLKEIYHEAVEEKYRFFSYGDAMLIL